jgi:hypothetical protein
VAIKNVKIIFLGDLSLIAKNMHNILKEANVAVFSKKPVMRLSPLNNPYERLRTNATVSNIHKLLIALNLPCIIAIR